MWFARSLVDTLVGEEEEEEEDPSSGESADDATAPLERSLLEPSTAGDEAEAPLERDPLTRGVKEDLTELTRNLTRGLWGVASFLAPSPSSPTAAAAAAADARSDGPEAVESQRLAGIRSDLEEIGGKLRIGISMLSNTKAVSEISKIASSILALESDEAEEKEEEEKETDEEQKIEVDAIGLTEDVAIFARNIAMHPETWLNFPLSEQDKSRDFEMSATQLEHASAVEHIAPRLAALRSELCPGHMSKGCFWKIYFVLLHSRLGKDEAELLSPQQIVETRATLLQDSDDAVAPDERYLIAPTAVTYENNPVEIDVVIEDPVEQCKSKDLMHEGHIKQHEEEVSNLSEETGDDTPPSTNTSVEWEEDITFSDLEDVDSSDDETVMDPRIILGTHGTDVLGSDSSQKTIETNDWLVIDSIDF